MPGSTAALVPSALVLTGMSVLAELATTLQLRLPLDELMARIVDAAAVISRCERTSLRLLDVSRTRLLVSARAGRNVLERGDAHFRVGEGLVGWVAANGQPLRVDRATEDPRYVVHPGAAPIASFLGVPLIASGHCIGVLSCASAEPAAFSTEDENSFVVIAALAVPHLEIARLERMARVDPLTGALNRNGLDDALARGLIAPPLAAAVVDLDHFKLVNDQYGHVIGDDVLRHVAAVLSEAVRATDAVVRHGGEEFVLVLFGAGRAQALQIAERARETIAATRIPTAGGEIAITTSIGVASLEPGETWTDLFLRADRAVYRAKGAGRDRVVADEDPA